MVKGGVSRRLPDTTLSLLSRLDDREAPTNRHVHLPPDLGKPADLDALPKQETVRRSAKVEHADLVALPEMLPLLHRDLASADLVHSHAAKATRPMAGLSASMKMMARVASAEM